MNPDTSLTIDSYAPLDAVLEALSEYGPSLTGGLFSHAPMVAEALCAMGHGDRSRAWVADHRDSLTPRPQARAPMDDDHWQQALGDSARFSDWAALFRNQIDRIGWRSTVDLWSSRLAPGFTTAACHGVLRTAHAARALTHAETDARCSELADGLGAWAALYRELPVAALEPRGELSPEPALHALEPLAGHEPAAAGLIADGFEALRDNHDFAHQVARVDLSGDLASRIDELVTAFAGMFVACAHTPYTAIVFTHAVTGAAAVRNLLPAIGETAGRHLAFRAWEAGCALKTTFARPLSGDTPPTARRPSDPVELIVSAVHNGDDHVIKLTEACVTTYRTRPARTLLEAACHGQSLLPPSRAT